MKDAVWEVTCPACGGVVDATDEADLVARAKEHTRDAHGYVVSEEHVLQSALRVGSEVSRTAKSEG
jgi:hypothetical protein